MPARERPGSKKGRNTRPGAKEGSSPRVLLLCGSPSDLDFALDAGQLLEELGIASKVRVVSAHRTPELTVECVRKADAEGFRAIIAFAGLSAHLAGVAAAHTQLPVIGVPLAVGPLQGVDAALATLQMPPGTPVAAVAIGGARNAALLAARVLGIAHPEIRERLVRLAEGERARYAPEKVEAEVARRSVERRRRERRRPQSST